MRYSFYKTTCVFTALLMLANLALQAQQTLPFDQATQRIVYKFTIPTDKPVKKKLLYNLAQDWFTQQPELFSRANTVDKPSETDKDKTGMRISKLFCTSLPTLRPCNTPTPKATG